MKHNNTTNPVCRTGSPAKWRGLSTLSRWMVAASSLMVLSGALGGCAATKSAIGALDPQQIHVDDEAQARHADWHKRDGKVLEVDAQHRLSGEAS